MDKIKNAIIIFIMILIVGFTAGYVYKQIEKFNEENNSKSNSTEEQNNNTNEEGTKPLFDVSKYIEDVDFDELPTDDNCWYHEEPVEGQNVAYCDSGNYIVDIVNNKVLKKFVHSTVWIGDSDSGVQYYEFEPDDNSTGDKLVLVGPNFDFIDYVGYFNENREQSSFIITNDGNALVTDGISFKIYDRTGKLLFTSKNHDRVTPVYKIDNYVAVIDDNKLSLVDYEDNLIVTFDTSIAENVKFAFYNYNMPAIYFEGTLDNENRISIGLIDLDQDLAGENTDIYNAHYYLDTQKSEFRKCENDIEYMQTR